MITVDDREMFQHPDIPELIGVPTTVQRLDAADFAFLDRNTEPVGIERSEIKNLMQKLRSGELEQQLVKCDAHYNTVILLVEGVYDQVSNFLAIYRQTNSGYYRARIYPNTRYDYTMALLIRLSELGIEIIQTPNFECSMMVVKSIYDQRTKPEEQHSLFKRIRPIRLPVKLSSNPAVPKLLALCNRMPEKVAIRLINRYGTIWNVLHAVDKNILETDGMGKGLLTKLKLGVGKEGEG